MQIVICIPNKNQQEIKMSKKIMIVDDDRDLLEELEERLQSNGYEVISFFDSISAVKMVRNIMPDLILLDIKMSKKNGFQVASEIKINSETESIPIIAMTAYFNETEPIPLMNLFGVQFCLIKPFKDEDMIMKIEQILNAENGKKE